VQKGEKLFIAVLLACGWPPHKTYKWQDMRRLISYGNEAYDYQEVWKEELKIAPIPVAHGSETDVEAEIRYPNQRSLKVLMRKDETVTIKKKVPGSLKAPIEEGVPVGQADYYVGNDRIASYPIVTTKQVGRWDVEFCAKKLLNHFLFCYNAR
ncbi:MAG: D-alanyl-D-alanine carboxypeptidase, partial [Lachnospiraceae bacterium]|nr:D-alanyl-D-alanine carboxypeptidase [Lachnospiraceae bacterium]